MTPTYKKPAFWIVAALSLLSALGASGAVPGGGLLDGGIGFVLSALVATGYASVRAFSKGADGKPAYKSTEFYLSCAAAVVCILGASGAWAEQSAVGQALGFIGAALAAAGYTARFQLPPR